MKGFIGLRVSSWAWSRPKPWPIQVSVATLDTPRSCIASKVTTLTRIPGYPRFGGPSLRLLVLFETKVPHEDFGWKP